MNKKPLAALVLAGVAATALAAPAQALGGIQAASILTAGASQAMLRTALQKRGVSLTPPAQDGTSLSFAAVERTVRAHNPMIQSLEKMVSSIGSADVSGQFFNQRLSYIQQINVLTAQFQSYEAAKANLDAAIDGATDSSTKAALTAMAEAMGTLAHQTQVSITMNDAEDDAETEIADAHFAMKKQAAHQSNQLVSQTESLYLALCTLQTNVDALDRGLAAIARSIPVVQKQVEIGMASKLDLLTIQNKQASLQSTRKTLEQQQQSMENSLSLLLGNDAGKTVHVQPAPVVQSRDIAGMNYAADLAEALKSSYTLWQKEDAVRQASNDYEKNKTSTVDAYKAAQIARDAAQEEAKTSFRKLFEDVSEKQRLVSAAEADLDLAAVNFRVAETKYGQGMISSLDYAAAQDELETAQQAVDTAKTGLFTAFHTYTWAKRGMI